jgi:soluble lytic murein transglycosylase
MPHDPLNASHRTAAAGWMGILILAVCSLLIAGCVLPVSSRDDQTPEGPPATATPSVPPTATSTPTSTPTPTPLPGTRVEIGDRWIFYGDYDRAEGEYLSAQAQDAEADVQSGALLGLARVYFYKGDMTSALQTLRQLIDSYPEAPRLAEAYYFLGRVFSELQRYDEAAEAFRAALEAQPGLLDAYLYEQIGDTYLAANNYPAALAAYETGSNSPRSGDRTSELVKLAWAYRVNDMAGTAQVIYQDLFNRAADDYVRAQMLFLSGQTHAAAGNLEEAHSSYLQAVDNYPLAYDSYSALVELVNAGVPVSELDRGLVDYFAAQYSVALSAFDRYLASNPGDAEGEATALYYKGLTFRTLGNYAAAVEAWDMVIQGYDGSSLWDEAWEQKGFTQWAYLDQHSEAVDTFLGFAAASPDHPRAAQFLDFAGRVAERGEDLLRAAQIWDRVTIDYPNSAGVYQASFLAGITYYRLEEFESARLAFERALSQSSAQNERAAALLWVGKCFLAQGNNLDAGSAWQQAALSDPTGYYAERARDLLLQRSPFTPPLAYDFSFDRAAERSAAEAWIRTTFSLEENTDLSAPGPLADDPRLQRGEALWRLGLYNEARMEFESLRVEVENDPADTYRLGTYLIDLGLFRSGITAIRQVLNLAGLDDASTLSAPKYFNRLRFGAYFPELIIPAAQENGFHPLLIFSIARQESLFEGFVRSAAGARGVMQIIPSTGQSIASRIGWPADYDDEDLYRPYVSVILGSNYFAQQRDQFEGDLYAALAAYNGGPGNAAIWHGLAGGDQDLFVEIVRFEETRRYIRSIYEIYNIYYQLYDRSP